VVRIALSLSVQIKMVTISVAKELIILRPNVHFAPVEGIDVVGEQNSFRVMSTPACFRRTMMTNPLNPIIALPVAIASQTSGPLFQGRSKEC